MTCAGTGLAFKRLLMFLACLASSGVAPLLAIFALKDAARFGPWLLLVVGAWLLALAAFMLVAAACVADSKLGKSAATVACVFGVAALVAYPLIAGFAGQDQWLSELVGALGVELLVTAPCILLALHLARFHASKKPIQMA